MYECPISADHCVQAKINTSSQRLIMTEICAEATADAGSPQSMSTERRP